MECGLQTVAADGHGPRAPLGVATEVVRERRHRRGPVEPGHVRARGGLVLLGDHHDAAHVHHAHDRERAPGVCAAAGAHDRDGDADAKISEEAAAAADAYATTFRESEDAAVKLMRDVGDTLGNVGKWVGDKFKGQ